MSKFHINPETGEPGKCSAEKGNCPFGDANNDHYGSAEDARNAAEQIYDAFDHGEEPSEHSTPGEHKMYENWLMEVEYTDWNWAQAGKVADLMVKKGELHGVKITDSDEMGVTLKLDPEVFASDSESKPKLELYISVKRNRVNDQFYINDEEMGDSEIEDVNNGREMRSYIENAVDYVYNEIGAGGYDDKLGLNA